jgi:putative acetyltransferase
MTGEPTLRPIRPEDDAAVAAIIRAVMTDFACTGPGYAIHDTEVDTMSQVYRPPRAAYYVVETDGRVIGGGGFGPLAGCDTDTCELRKMYFLPEARGRGLGRALLERCLGSARESGFRRMYLETTARMTEARALYEKLRFTRLPGPLGATGHHGCDAWYLRELK